MRTRARLADAVAFAAMIAGVSCNNAASFECSNNDQCLQAGEAGRCEQIGFCSFPDPACASGWRYGSAAPASVAGDCVEPVGGDTTGATTTTTSTGSTTTLPATTSTSSTSTGSSGTDTDATTGPPPCGTQPDADTIALYRFEDPASVVDALGGFNGTWIDGTPNQIPGPRNCGMGVSFSGTIHGVVDDAQPFHLPQGSFDVWVRVPDLPPARSTGIVSRDASDSLLPGHLTLWFTPDGRLAIRMQPLDVGMGTPPNQVRCTAGPVPTGQWLHVGVNFGPPGTEMYVDGVLANGTGDVVIFNSAVSCENPALPLGIDGNANPWILGASGGSSAEGSAVPAAEFFGGAIDELRISGIRRDFSAM